MRCDQDYYGFQMGMDVGAPVGDEGGFNFGITGGYQNSTMSFPNTADRIKFNSVNGGVYASYTSGIFFVNALGYGARGGVRSARFATRADSPLLQPAR